MVQRVCRTALLSLLFSCLALGALQAESETAPAATTAEPSVLSQAGARRRALIRSRALLAAALAAALGCHRAAPARDPAGPRLEGDRISYAANAPELAALATIPVMPEAAATASTLRTTGRLAWDEDATARVASPVAGRVVRLLADVANGVRRGQALALLASPDLGQAQADASRAATDLAAAERTLERSRTLYEHGAAPRKDLEAAEADRARSAVESARARARLGLLVGGNGGSGGVDQRYRLVSPIRGVVVDRALNPGQEVRPDAQAPLFTISDPTRLWVYLDLTEKDLGRVKPGMALTLRTAAYPGRVFAGRVEVVGDALDPATRTVKARGFLANPERLLKAEMYVDVEVSDPAARPGLEVPTAAIVGDGDRRFVFVEEGRGRFRRQPVTPGPERSGRTQILGGLAQGQRVVTEGSLLLESVLASRA
jgi:cobalt-zinc-cadmium efflux system membrane fusion protein